MQIVFNLFDPIATAITHNSLLRSNASSQRVKFVHAESLLKHDANWKVDVDQTKEILHICEEVDKIDCLLPEKREIVKCLIWLIVLLTMIRRNF